ncbi:ABC transporter substrate-binding protein [Cerasicoccus fimbriatus]|uniref:ABC transporter substrate-binding protein n=1 Tax=Cerasicoccus fimbriatus TaxID=3014554 RepID=UPI0022B3D72A|nr:extracellular solute-binding protein [Cerasicoccus sp. TK19100]
MLKNSIIVLLIAIVVGVPIALRKEQDIVKNPDATLVIISPHNEAIRYEFETAFRKWYEGETGKVVVIDWRSPGGTSEIVKYLNAEYTNQFRLYWTKELGRPWNDTVAGAFDNRRIELPADPADDDEAQSARRAFLDSNVGVGIDLFHGGGWYDFNVKAQQGQLVASNVFEKHPGWFTEDIIPQTFSGEVLWDNEHRYVGAVLSSFGIIFNRDELRSAGFEGEPTHWRDLADPKFYGSVAVADPTKSGSITKAFEMLVQQQMQELVAEGMPEEQAVPQGWMNGMQLIQLISANARYFTDSATKPVLDVSAGDCAIGMAIDFYGRFQEQNLVDRDGGDRFGFIMPPGGSSISADPIGLLRGAPNEEIAEAFIEYTLSPDGQKLWDFKVGAPGGPIQYALRRSPIRRDLYEPQYAEYRSDPTVLPYEETEGFVYQPSWTGRLFSELRFVVRAAFIDPGEELRAAWGSILRAREEGRTADADVAYAVLSDLSAIDFEQAKTTIDEKLGEGALGRLELLTQISGHFREQYTRAQQIAEGGQG